MGRKSDSRRSGREATLERLRAELAELRARIDSLSELESPRSSLPDHPWQAIVCRVGDEQVGLPVEGIDEVVPLVLGNPIPEAPGWVYGLVNVRGRSLVVVDILARMTGESRIPDADELILVTGVDAGQGRALGIVVQGVHDVLDVEAGETQPVDATVPHARYLEGVIVRPDGNVLVLSLEALLATDPISMSASTEADA